MENYRDNGASESKNDNLSILNSIKTSKNALDICNSIGCMNPKIRSFALQYGLTYKNVFNGNDNSQTSKPVLSIIDCKQKPIFNKKIFKSISIIKWNIYEFKKNKNFNQLCGEWIGVLAGLALYFDELDENAFNKTQYYQDICRNLTIDDL